MVISKNLYRVISLLKCVTLKKYTLLYISLTISLKMPISYFSILECSVFVVVRKWGWSGGAMVLGKLPVPGRPTNLDYSRARAYCAYSRCGWGLFGHFYSHLSFLSSFSLSLGDGPI